MTDMVSTKNLSKRYRGAKSNAIDNLDFGINEGEFFGLLGVNGSGKTTLLSMLCGLLKPTEGDVFIRGQAQPFTRSEIRREMALVPQELALYPSLTLRENLEFFGCLYDLPKAALEINLHEVVELVQLSAHLDQNIASFSAGMKRRANLALSLVHKPDLIFLDEPMVQVDAHSRQILLRGLKALNQAGATLIYTSHYLEEVEALCSRIMIIDQGRSIMSGEPNALRAEAGVENLTELFLRLTTHA